MPGLPEEVPIYRRPVIRIKNNNRMEKNNGK